MSLAGVVLAAGRSERMGTPKALLDFRGQPFVVRVLEALEALDLKPRVVVLGIDAPRIRPVVAAHDCLVLENPDVASGPIGSLRPSGLVAWPVDLPHVRITTIERLLEAYRRSGAPAVVPAFADRRGHPVIWGRALFEELETSEAASRHGARAVLSAHEPELVVVAVDDPAVIDDLNTPEDYERLVRGINRDIY